MLNPQWLNFAPDFRATNTREPSGRSENDYRKLAQFFPLAFAHLSWYIVVAHNKIQIIQIETGDQSEGQGYIHPTKLNSDKTSKQLRQGSIYSDTSRINFDTLRFYSDKTRFSPESTANYYPLTSSIHIFSKYTS